MDQQSIDNAAIRIASDKLRDAILAAKAGTCVVTPADPVKLPRDPAPAREAGRVGSSLIAQPETKQEAVLRLFAAGRTRHTIAREMDFPSWHEVDGILRTLRYAKPSLYWRAVEQHTKARGLVV
jgi:hypothetical protein